MILGWSMVTPDWAWSREPRAGLGPGILTFVRSGKDRLVKVLLSCKYKYCQKAQTFSQGPLKLTCAFLSHCRVYYHLSFFNSTYVICNFKKRFACFSSFFDFDFAYHIRWHYYLLFEFMQLLKKQQKNCTKKLDINFCNACEKGSRF